MPRVESFQAILGKDEIKGSQLVMLFGLDATGQIWVKTNALDRECEWHKVDGATPSVAAKK